MMLKINNLTMDRKSHLCLTGVLGCLYAVLQVQAKLTFWI